VEYDYVIVGAGVVGLATAFHLSRMEPGARIIVLDKAPGPGAGDSSKSAAAFRVFFTSRLNMALARSSVYYYRSVQEGGFDLGMRFVGYLFMVDEARRREVEAGLRYADKAGLEYRLLDPGTLEERLGVRTSVEGSEEAEILGAGDIVEGILIPDAGILMADRLVQYYYEAARQRGVSYGFDSRVTGFIHEPRQPLGIEGEPFPWQDSRISGVVLEGGREVRARRKTIVAAGAWTPYLLEPLGVDSYSRPKKRQIFVVKAETPEQRKALYAKGLNREGVSPMLIFPSLAYMRPAPEEEAYWTGYSDELGRPFRLEEDPAPEMDFYIYTVHPLISIYMPQFEGAPARSAWAGHYDISPDGQPVIYEPFNSDLIVSAGTSGSGIMKADAIGRITASLALGLDEAELYGGETLKVAWLGYEERLVEKELLVI